jgi:hypothetical protein
MSLSPEIQQQRYAAIELAYSERLWPEVEQLSQELLAEVPADPADPLRLRLELLLGHTRLYGLGDSSAARQHYANVLEHGTEATLRDIAQQSLDQCEQLERPSQGAASITPDRGNGNGGAKAASPWLDSQDETQTAAGQDAEPAKRGNSVAASPWMASEPAQPAAQPVEPNPVEPVLVDTMLADSSPEVEPPLLAEIVEEPEQIAVALADPQRRQELQLEERLVIQPSDDAKPADPLHFDPSQLSPGELEELSRGLLLLSLR